MILPPGFRGVAFGDAADGDGRTDPEARRAMSAALAVPTEWAIVRQVHGARVIAAAGPGWLGDADGLVTQTPLLPLAVGTADCLPVAVEGDGAVALVHAGWRGLAAGVVAAAVAAMQAAGVEPQRAAIGPGIGPCCYEVGPEVSTRLAGSERRTTWGTGSVDLAAAASTQLGNLAQWRSEECTRCGEGWHSYRRNGGESRQVAVAWLPV